MIDLHLNAKKKHSLSVERAYSLSPLFLNSYLAAPHPTRGHYQGDSLTNPMLINVFDTYSTRRSPGAL